MKFLYILLFLCCTTVIFAQEEIEEEEIEVMDETTPVHSFLRVSPSLFLVNSSPSTIDYEFWDHDLSYPDSISGSRDIDNMWTYGLNFGFGRLIGKSTVINLDNHIGWGSNGKFFNYVGQLGVGREFRFGEFYIQPILSMGFVSSIYNLGTHPSNNKGYFQINDTYINNQLTARLKSRAVTLSPAVLLEYSIRRNISVFGKISIHYSFWETNYLSFSGETDEVDEDGNAVTASERIDFNHNRLDFYINNKKIEEKRSPYIPYNFNSLLIQIGVSFAFGNEVYDEFEEE